MKSKHVIVAVMVALMSLGSVAMAQTKTEKETPQKVETGVKVLHSAEWYKTQENLWKVEIDRNPKNEEAWGNYYRAVRYRSWCESVPNLVKRLNSIVKDMEKAIPDTYTYYIVKFLNDTHAEGNPGMAKAIKMRPDAVDDYPDFVSYLMQTNDDVMQKEILSRWYDSGTYSSALLNNAYNELIGLAPNAIIFAHGDTQTFSKLIVQQGKGVRPDVTIVNVTFMLYHQGYRKHIEKKLGLPDFGELVDNGTYVMGGGTWNEVVAPMYRHFIENTDRPIYFSSRMALPDCTEKLYSEGLVIRYSEKDYDNLVVKRRNFEELYLTDYLRESFQPETYPASADEYNLNYIPCFKSLLDHYKQTGNTSRYNELRSLMLRIVEQIDVPDQERQKYYEEIDR